MQTNTKTESNSITVWLKILWTQNYYADENSLGTLFNTLTCILYTMFKPQRYWIKKQGKTKIAVCPKNTRKRLKFYWFMKRFDKNLISKAFDNMWILWSDVNSETGTVSRVKTIGISLLRSHQTGNPERCNRAIWWWQAFARRPHVTLDSRLYKIRLLFSQDDQIKVIKSNSKDITLQKILFQMNDFLLKFLLLTHLSISSY